MYDNGIFVVIFFKLTFCKHRPVRNIRQPVIPLTDCDSTYQIMNKTLNSPCYESGNLIFNEVPADKV